jgi:hypothetical protein
MVYSANEGPYSHADGTVESRQLPGSFLKYWSSGRFTVVDRVAVEWANFEYSSAGTVNCVLYARIDAPVHFSIETIPLYENRTQIYAGESLAFHFGANSGGAYGRHFATVASPAAEAYFDMIRFLNFQIENVIY